jgi:hypothetical protein
MAQGGSLSINPKTGLPEAGFLDRLLPTIIGAGLTFFSGGAINPLTAAAIVGGGETIRTGDLGKGFMAGLGAFGGAGLGGALGGAGSLGAQAAAITEGGAGAGQLAQGAKDAFTSQPFLDQAKGSLATLGQPGGLSNLGSNLMEQYGGKYGAMAAAFPAVSEIMRPPDVKFPEKEEDKNKSPALPMPRVYNPIQKDPRKISSEYNYFDPSNPYPGFMRVGGGATGGVVKAAAGRYLQGPGDGTSDSIPATIGNAQPARLADGEFVIDARTVSEIGNGSSNAGAKKLYAMMERVHRERKRAKRGQDSNADRFLPK